MIPFFRSTHGNPGLLFAFLFVGCFIVTTPASTDSIIDIPVPSGCSRVEYPPDSFSGWIQRIPLKNGTSIRTYRGTYLPSRVYDRMAVLDRPLLFDDDLEQCADYCMRLWADYHKETDKLDELYLFTYHGDKRYFAASDLSYTAFLRNAFAYTNSYSLKKGCVDLNSGSDRLVAVSDPGLRPGDMFIQNDTGGIGHVSIIVDACEADDGSRFYLVGFSFMPAQEFHIEKAPLGRIDGRAVGREYWFSYEGYIRFLNAYYPFGVPVLRRFD